jgi:hypothetical protein
MADRFRLPCPNCSTANEVDQRQAGQSIVCLQCRSTIEVPTLRGLRQLQTAEPPKDQKSKRQSEGPFVVSRLTFAAGLLTLVIGLGVGAGLWYAAGQLETEPPAETAHRLDEVYSAIDRETLTQFWVTWHEQVLTRPPGEYQESRWAENRRIARRQRRLGTIFLGLMPLGAAIMFGSAYIRK